MSLARRRLRNQVTALQQWKATRLPDRQGWEELQEEEGAKIAQLEASLGAAADKQQSAEETGKGPEAKEKD